LVVGTVQIDSAGEMAVAANSVNSIMGHRSAPPRGSEAGTGVLPRLCTCEHKPGSSRKFRTRSPLRGRMLKRRMILRLSIVRRSGYHALPALSAVTAGMRCGCWRWRACADSRSTGTGPGNLTRISGPSQSHGRAIGAHAGALGRTRVRKAKTPTGGAGLCFGKRRDRGPRASWIGLRS
jgi:hypothetical protein